MKPWLKPETLMQTDPEIHYSLLGLCRQAELEIDKWVAVSDKTTKEGQTLFGGIFARFKGRKQRSEFEEVMRRIFGMEL